MKPSKLLREAKTLYETRRQEDLNKTGIEKAISRVYTKLDSLFEACSPSNSDPDSSWGFMERAGMDFDHAISLAEEDEEDPGGHRRAELAPVGRDRHGY